MGKFVSPSRKSHKISMIKSHHERNWKRQIAFQWRLGKQWQTWNEHHAVRMSVGQPVEWKYLTLSQLVVCRAVNFSAAGYVANTRSRFNVRTVSNTVVRVATKHTHKYIHSDVASHVFDFIASLHVCCAVCLRLDALASRKCSPVSGCSAVLYSTQNQFDCDRRSVKLRGWCSCKGSFHYCSTMMLIH